MSIKGRSLLLLWAFSFLLSCKTVQRESELAAGSQKKIQFTQNGILVNGRYQLIRGGSLQWFRIAEEAWEDRIKKFKAAGFNTIGMYIAWNQIEPSPGQFQFDRPNIRKFLELAKKYDLYVLVRPGPYITNEMDGGGLPAWLTRNATKKSFEADGRPNLRTHDPDFIEPVRRYFTALNDVLKPYLITNGGPVIMYAIENEYNWFERSVKTDRLFWYEGGLERPLDQTPSTEKYITALRDIVESTGIDVPIVTCPGDGRVSATGDVPRVYPFPNIYEWATEDQTDEAAWKLLADMHSANHGGIYSNAPSGSLEVNRSAGEFRRLFSAGLDAAFAFNVVGMAQEGYMNAVLLAARSGDVPPHWGAPGEKPADSLSTIFDFKWSSITNAFFEPMYGYVSNVIDYNGAISPSGVLNDSFFQFRRDNFFYDMLGEDLPAAGPATRTTRNSKNDIPFYVDHPEAGSREKDGYAFYRLDLGRGASMLSIVNQTGKRISLAKDAIHIKDASFPKYTAMVLPLADESRSTYTAMLLHDYELTADLSINYTTAEFLTSRPFRGHHLMVVYGEEGDQGEISFQGAGPFTFTGSEGAGVTIHENGPDRFTISMTYSPFSPFGFKDRNGKLYRLITTTRGLAGKFWFLHHGSEDILLTGFDYIDADSLSYDENGLHFTYDYDDRMGRIFVLKPSSWRLEGTTSEKAYPHDPEAFVYDVEKKIQVPALPDIATGRVMSDVAESQGTFDDASWRQLDEGPKALEFADIFQGHAWYRTQFHLDDLSDDKKQDHLYVESASDFVGIYVNGHYVTTVAPLGTEINNNTGNQRYRFAGIRDLLVEGTNHIAFRTEIWGHGSFMFGRGTLIATRAKFPALGYEGLKGLYGKAHAAGKDLQQWRVRGGLGGSSQGWARPDYDDTNWPSAQIPLALEKGDIRWYRTGFDSHLLPDQSRLHAPIGIEIKGNRAKATIFLNGRIIGRWLSDSEWLRQGSWGRPARSVWVPLSPDQFPLLREVIQQGWNSLAIVFEDTSKSDAAAGEITSVKLRYNEEFRRLDQGGQMVHGIRGRHQLQLQP